MRIRFLARTGAEIRRGIQEPRAAQREVEDAVAQDLASASEIPCRGRTKLLSEDRNKRACAAVARAESGSGDLFSRS